MSAEDWILGYDDDRDGEEEEILEYGSIDAETKKAYLLNTKRGQCWIAKSVIVKHDRKEKFVTFPNWVHLIYVTKPPNAFTKTGE